MSHEYVDRESSNISRICQTIRSAVGIVLIEAPRGYGKSLLAQCLADGVDGFIRIDGRDLVQHPSAVGTVSPLVIDGVTETLPPELLDDLCVDGRKVVIAGRDLSHLIRWAGGRKALRLGMSDLALGREDIRELAGPILGDSEASVFADSALGLTMGWPALVRALLADADQPESIRFGVPGERWQRGPSVAQLVDDCLGELDAAAIDAFGQLAHLPSFSSSCVTSIVGPGGLARARANGLPVVQTRDGWLGIAQPVAEVLRSRGAFRTLSAELLGPVLVASGGLAYAAKALLAAGDASVAADLLGSVPGYRFDEHNQAELAGMIRSLDSRLDPEPELMLLLARVHHNRAEIDQQRACLEEAERRATVLGDKQSTMEAQTELLFLDLGEGRVDLLPRLVDLEEQVTADTLPTTRVRLREVRAMYLAQSSILSDVYASSTLFRDVSYEWESLGEPGRAAWTLRLFAAVTCWHLGHYREALEALERAAVLVEGKPASLAKTLGGATWFAAMAADRQRFESLSARIRTLLPGLSLNWINGLITWSEMTLAGLEMDQPMVDQARAQAAILLGALLDHPTGAVFLADSACALAYVGDSTAAMESLRDAVERRDEASLEVDLAEIVVQARVGDAALVPELAKTLEQSGELPFERRWRIDLELMIAQGRASGVVPKVSDLNRIKDQATKLGLEQLWDKVAAPLGLTEPSSNALTWLTLLGSFAISGGPTGEPKPLAPGHSTELVKYLAAAGGDVPLEVVIEILWPDGDPEKGRKRLRNVINRTRASLGSESVLRTGDLVRLGPGTQTDLARFRELGRQALTGSGEPGQRAKQAVRALNLYQGELLPDDLYSEWVEGHRETARLTATGLLDLVLAHPTPEVVPSWLLETAARVGAQTEELWVDIAQFSSGHGAMECCRVAALRAEAIAHQLGYGPSEATRELLADYR